MEVTSPSLRSASLASFRQIEWDAVSTWLLGFGLIVYLGLAGGGYDPLVHNQVGIAVWWILLAAVGVGALPRRSPGVLGWCGLGLMTALAIWTALSLGWTESPDKTWADLGRVATYLGVFALALAVRGSKGVRRMVAAVATGMAFLAIVALLSRLHPAWFPDADETARFLASSRDRLSYPLGYWNGLAALIAVGLPLMLHIATAARSSLFRALAAAALPAMGLALFFTLSRGGITAAVLGLTLFLALAPDRLPRIATLLVAGIGGAILIVAASQRDALQEGLVNSAASQQGNEMLAMTIVVCAGVGLIQAGLSLLLLNGLRPAWTEISRRQSVVFVFASLTAALIAAAALNAPGRASDAWGEFKSDDGPGAGSARLSSVAGESRYQLWASALEENRAEPVTGTGSGTFEYWWARNGDRPIVVRDTHSLYMQTLGELGVVGFVLLAGLLVTIFVGGGRTLLRARQGRESQLAAALAGCAAFCITAIFDWTWQIPVLPVAFLLLAAVLITAGGKPMKAPLPLALRVAFVPLALVAVTAIAIPLSAATLIRQSQAAAGSANPAEALQAARSAQNVQPGAATPRLQQALVLEAQGELALAAVAAREATEREPTNWRTWLVRARLSAEQGQARASLSHYREARALNPRSPIFTR